MKVASVQPDYMLFHPTLNQRRCRGKHPPVSLSVVAAALSRNCRRNDFGHGGAATVGRGRGRTRTEGRANRQRTAPCARYRPARHVARCAARESRADRHEKRLRPGPVRRLHGDRQWATHQQLPDARRDACGRRDHHHRGPGRRRRSPPDAGRIRAPRRIAMRLLHPRPDLLGRRADGGAQGGLAKPAAPPMPISSRRSATWPREAAHEALPLRTGQRRRVGLRIGSRAHSQVHRRRHQPDRSHEAADRDAGASRRHRRAAAWRYRRDPGRRVAHRCAGHQQRARRGHARAASLSAAVAGGPGRRLDAAAQQGHDRRKSAPAHPLRLFLRYDQALQQAYARVGLRGTRRPQPDECRAGRERQLHRGASLRHGGRDDGAGCANRDCHA